MWISFPWATVKVSAGPTPFRGCGRERPPVLPLPALGGYGFIHWLWPRHSRRCRCGHVASSRVCTSVLRPSTDGSTSCPFPRSLISTGSATHQQPFPPYGPTNQNHHPEGAWQGCVPPPLAGGDGLWPLCLGCWEDATWGGATLPSVHSPSVPLGSGCLGAARLGMKRVLSAWIFLLRLCSETHWLGNKAPCRCCKSGSLGSTFLEGDLCAGSWWGTSLGWCLEGGTGRGGGAAMELHPGLS